MAYTINVDEALRNEIQKYIDTNKNIDTKELLAAYIRIAQELTRFKQDLEIIADKIPRL
jgi:hypothetical protein